MSEIVKGNWTPNDSADSTALPSDMEFNCPEADFVAAMTEICKECALLPVIGLVANAVGQYRRVGYIDTGLLVQIEKAIEPYL